jgi:hypothetical protein
MRAIACLAHGSAPRWAAGVFGGSSRDSASTGAFQQAAGGVRPARAAAAPACGRSVGKRAARVEAAALGWLAGRGTEPGIGGQPFARLVVEARDRAEQADGVRMLRVVEERIDRRPLDDRPAYITITASASRRPRPGRG